MSALVWPGACSGLLQSWQWFHRFFFRDNRSKGWVKRCKLKFEGLWKVIFKLALWNCFPVCFSSKLQELLSWGTSWDLLPPDMVESWLQWADTSHVCHFCERCNAKRKQCHISVKQTEVIQSKHRSVTCTGKKHNADVTFLAWALPAQQKHVQINENSFISLSGYEGATTADGLKSSTLNILLEVDGCMKFNSFKNNFLMDLSASFEGHQSFFQCCFPFWKNWSK